MNKSSFKKGEDFEKFVEEQLFSKKDYILVHRTGTFDQNKDRFAENTLLPDFKFRCKFTNQEFYVEAKFRSKFNSLEKLDVMNKAQKERFINIQETEKIPVFIIIGYQGSPMNPDKLSLIPLNELLFLGLYAKFLDSFKIKKQSIQSEKLNFKSNFSEVNKQKSGNKEEKDRREAKENSNGVPKDKQGDNQEQKQDNKQDNKQESRKEKPINNKKRNILFASMFFLGIIYTISNYQSIYKYLVPPKPEIISSSSDDSFSSIFEYTTKVIVNVRNNGGDGYVVVKAIVYQDGAKYQKTKQMYLLSYQTERFDFIFDEVEYLKSTPEYIAKTYSLED